MTNFEKWDSRYKKHWCTREQLERLVELGVLSETEYKEITGEEYPI